MDTADWTTQSREKRVEAMMTDLVDLIPDDRRKYIESLATEAKTSTSDSPGLEMKAPSGGGDDQIKKPENFY